CWASHSNGLRWSDRLARNHPRTRSRLGQEPVSRLRCLAGSLELAISPPTPLWDTRMGGGLVSGGFARLEGLSAWAPEARSYWDVRGGHDSHCCGRSSHAFPIGKSPECRIYLTPHFACRSDTRS